MPGYALPMTHPYGITLNRVWTEWATNYGVSPTVAAAIFLISEARPIHEVTAKLAPDEFEQVADIVSRWPFCRTAPAYQATRPWAKRTNRAGFFEHDAKDTGGPSMKLQSIASYGGKCLQSEKAQL